MVDGATQPGRTGYLVAAALLTVGVALFLAAVIPAKRAVSEAVEGMQRVVIGSGELDGFHVDQPGPVTIHYEPRSPGDRRSAAEAAAEPQLLGDHRGFETETTWEPELWISKAVLLGKINKLPLDFVPTANTVVYRTGEHAGHSLFEVELPEAGSYFLGVEDWGMAGDVAAGTIGPAPIRPRVLAIGSVPVGRLKDGFLGVYGGAVALGLLGCLASIVALITWARRHGTRTERLDDRPAAWDAA